MAMVPDTVPVEALFIVNEALAPPDLPITFAVRSSIFRAAASFFCAALVLTPNQAMHIVMIIPKNKRLIILLCVLLFISSFLLTSQLVHDSCQLALVSDEHIAWLTAVCCAHDACLLELVHESSGTVVTDRESTLYHTCTSLLR